MKSGAQSTSKPARGASSASTLAATAVSAGRRSGAAAAAAARAAADDDDDIASSGTESDDLDLTRAGDDSDDDDEDEEEEDDDDDDDDPNTVNVEFSFFDPREIDFKSVRRLLERYLPGEEDTFDASGCAETIIAQRAVGTMVKVNDDQDVYAFATVLPVALHKVRRPPTPIYFYFITACGSALRPCSSVAYTYGAFSMRGSERRHVLASQCCKSSSRRSNTTVPARDTPARRHTLNDVDAASVVLASSARLC